MTDLKNDLARYTELSQWDYVFNITDSLLNDNEKQELESLRAKIQGKIEKGDRWDKSVQQAEIRQDLESQVRESKNFIKDILADKDILIDEIAKLKEELEMEETINSGLVGTIAKLVEKDGFNLSMIAKLKEEALSHEDFKQIAIFQVKQLQSKLDKIKALTESNFGPFTKLRKLKEILAKHEDKI